MLTAVTIQRASSIEVHLVAAAGDEESHAAVEPKDGPSPIAPEAKELAWGAGAFVVFAVLMRLVLYPRLKKSMDSRYSSIRSGHEQADAARAAARAEVAEYESQLATVRAEAHERIETARATLESERAERIGALNASIAERRQQATADAEAARQASQGDVEAAAVDVVRSAVELATGHAPDADAVRSAVAASMMEGAAR